MDFHNFRLDTPRTLTPPFLMRATGRFMPNNFEQVVQRVAPEAGNFDYPKVACPDQWVGWVNHQTFSPADFQRRSISDGRQPEDLACHLILESPHSSEFTFCPNCDRWNPIGPANGKTGDGIRDNIPKIIAHFAQNETFKLALVNAVQFQCSLGRRTNYSGDNLVRIQEARDNRKRRDLIFRQYWDMFGKDDFKNRLRGIYQNRDILYQPPLELTRT